MASGASAHRDSRGPGGARSGPGAEWLAREADRTRYFLIGERHATAEIPALSGALYAEAADAGYDYAALEVGPLAGQKANALLREGGYKALETFLTTDEKRWIVGFDALLIVPNVTPATQVVE